VAVDSSFKEAIIITPIADLKEKRQANCQFKDKIRANCQFKEPTADFKDRSKPIYD
jgi:hypothetical protein